MFSDVVDDSEGEGVVNTPVQAIELVAAQATELVRAVGTKADATAPSVARRRSLDKMIIIIALVIVILL